MGNVSVTAVLNQTSYYPGDYVQGVLKATAKSNTSQPLTSLVLKFRSAVRTSHSFSVPNNPADPSAGTHTETIYEKNRLAEVEVKVAVPNTPLSAGEHSFPFCLQLPLSIQPTYYRESWQESAWLHNYLKVSLRGGKDKSLKATKTDVIVLAPPPARPIGPLVCQESVMEVKAACCCCCFGGGGNVVLRCPRTGPDAVFPAQQQEYILEVDNQAKHAFKRLKVELVEYCAHRCHGSRYMETSEVALDMELDPRLGPGQMRALLDPKTVPQHATVPGAVQPDVLVSGWVHVRHAWRFTLVNASAVGRNVQTLSNDVTVYSTPQPPAPAPAQMPY